MKTLLALIIAMVGIAVAILEAAKAWFEYQTAKEAV